MHYPWFRVTWSFDGCGSFYLIKAKEIAHAHEAAKVRLPGIVVVSVEPAADGDAPVPATLSPAPPPRSFSAQAEIPARESPVVDIGGYEAP